MHQGLIPYIMEFVSLIAYVILSAFAILSAILYTSAYYRMKRTKIIGALALMLYAIAIDTTWWLITEWLRFTNPANTYYAFSVHPFALVITKTIMAIGVLNFAYRSVKEDNVELEKCLEEIPISTRGDKKCH